MTRGSAGRLRLSKAPLVATLAVVAGVVAAACGGGTTPGATGTSTHGAGGTGTTGATSSSTSSTTTIAPPPPPLARGQQGTSAQIPWTEVGAGWSLAILNPSNASNLTTAGPRSLFVVDPAGGRYLVTSSLQKGEQIADWSGDAQRALLTDVNYSPAAGSTSTAVREISLVSGTILEQFTLGGQADLSFSRPRGLAILYPGNQSSNGQTTPAQRLSLSGSVELTFPSTFSHVGAYDGAAIYTPDGTAVVAGASGGLAVLSNAGGTVEQQVPIAVTGGCAPVKWWQAGVVLAACGSGLVDLGVTYGDSVWLVPLSGGSPTQLLPAMLTSGDGQIGLARTDIWEVGGDLYGVYAIACGATAVARVGPDNTATVLTVPGVTGNPDVLGAVGNQLAVEAIVSCDVPNHPNFALLWWNPATNATSVVMGQPLTSGSVESAFLYPAAGNYP
jgi:hypothetical protein